MKPSSKGNVSRKKRADAGDLLKRAMEHPGVADLMEVYAAFQKYEEATKAHDLLKATRQLTSLSSSSGPLLHQSG